MYAIAICDDDKEFTEYLQELCSDMMHHMDISFQISLYYSVKELSIAFATGEKIDLLLLDIKLDEENGIEFARSLRQDGYDTSIVLMSSDDSYLLDGYTIQPVYFLLKPITYEKLEQAVQADLKQKMRNETITVKCGQQSISLAVESIIYLEVMDHTLTIHTRTEDYRTRLTMSQLLGMLPGQRFCRCHKSYAVHLASVQSISRTEGVTLGNMVRLPIGRKYYEAFQKCFIEFFHRY